MGDPDLFKIGLELFGPVTVRHIKYNGPVGLRATIQENMSRPKRAGSQFKSVWTMNYSSF